MLNQRDNGQGSCSRYTRQHEWIILIAAGNDSDMIIWTAYYSYAYITEETFNIYHH
jgi:hypothetical protein